MDGSEAYLVKLLRQGADIYLLWEQTARPSRANTPVNIPWDPKDLIVEKETGDGLCRIAFIRKRSETAA